MQLIHARMLFVALPKISWTLGDKTVDLVHWHLAHAFLATLGQSGGHICLYGVWGYI